VQRLAELLRTFFLVDILKGLWLTLKYTPQPAFTFQYPAERRPVSPRFRGVLRLSDGSVFFPETCQDSRQVGIPRSIVRRSA